MMLAAAITWPNPDAQQLYLPVLCYTADYFPLHGLWNCLAATCYMWIGAQPCNCHC